MSKPRVAFLGLGTMGSGMARRIARAGFPLAVFNRHRERADILTSDGAVAADSPRSAAAGADVILSMVADDTASRSIWLGEHGALAGAPSGSVLIEASTLGLSWVRELAAAAEARGCRLLDAPVTGSRSHAAAGELCFLVGGSADSLDRVLPILSAMSRAVVHLGPQGSGCVMKIINNFLCGVQAASLAEAVALIERSGLDRTKAGDLLGQGAPGSPLVKTLFARMAAQDYEPHFRLELMAKDLTYACNEAGTLGLNLSTATAALKLFERARDEGDADRDFSAVVESLRR